MSLAEPQHIFPLLFTSASALCNKPTVSRDFPGGEAGQSLCESAPKKCIDQRKKKQLERKKKTYQYLKINK